MKDVLDPGTGELFSVDIPGERSTVSFTLPEDLSLDGWVAVGKSLEAVERSHMWWIGDWLVFGKRYGDGYEPAIRATGLSYSSLSKAKMLALRYRDFCLWRQNLGWHHHKAAAAVSDDRVLEELAVCKICKGRRRPGRHRGFGALPARGPIHAWRTVERVLAIGEQLARTKEAIGHGHYTAWVEAEFGWSLRTAQRLTATWDAFKSANLALLEPRALAFGQVPPLLVQAHHKGDEPHAVGPFIDF